MSMSSKSSRLRLRIAFEGDDYDPIVHQRKLARLKNEWPELYGAIEGVAYDDDPVDLYAIAEGLHDAGVPPQGSVATGFIEDYLDNAIRSWRRIANDADHKHFDIAPYYVDAFQSVRASLLGETLPLDEET